MSVSVSAVAAAVPRKAMLFANTEWYLYNFRRSLAAALRDAGYEVLLVSPPGPYGEKLRALGFRWIPAPMERRSLNPLRELALVRWLHRLVREERVDVVHGFTIKCAVYGSLAARLAGVPARVNAVAGMGYVFTSVDLKARLLRPVVRTLPALTTMMKSPVSMCGANSTLCLPRRRTATAVARRPRILSEASTTNQLWEISLGVGLNVFMAAPLSCSKDESCIPAGHGCQHHFTRKPPGGDSKVALYPRQG